MDKEKNTSWTKEQKQAYNREYAAKNKEKIQAYQKKWRAENKEYIAAYEKENAEKIKENKRIHRETHEEEYKQRWQKWYKENPERSARRRFTESRNKAIKRRKLTWTITFEEYVSLIQMPCYYCNYEIGDPVKRSCGLDRVDSSRGYEIDNVVSCCYACNTMKSDKFSSEEMLAAAKAVLEIRKSKLKPKTTPEIS
jgi:hypothetical protein